MSLISSLPQVTVAFAIFGAIYCLVKNRANPPGRTLEMVVSKLLAASSLPTGVLLLASAFDKSLLVHVSDSGVYVAAAGVALLFVGIKELFK